MSSNWLDLVQGVSGPGLDWLKGKLLFCDWMVLMWMESVLGHVELGREDCLSNIMLSKVLSVSTVFLEELPMILLPLKSVRRIW